jgi:hypothetical protein
MTFHYLLNIKKSDTLMQEKRGVTHINMMDLLQQYAIGNGKFKIIKAINQCEFRYQAYNV